MQWPHKRGSTVRTVLLIGDRYGKRRLLDILERSIVNTRTGRNNLSTPAFRLQNKVKMTLGFWSDCSVFPGCLLISDSTIGAGNRFAISVSLVQGSYGLVVDKNAPFFPNWKNLTKSNIDMNDWSKNRQFKLHRVPLTTSYLIHKQECIPVGCVPSTAVAISPSMHAPLLPHIPPPHTHTPAMQAPPCHTHLPLWTESQTGVKTLPFCKYCCGR